MTVRLLLGDVRTILPTLDAGSVRCCVTSPPYFGLRDYGVVGQLGMESTPDAYVASLVAVFREVRRVLSGDGTLWLNLGDSYAGSGKGGNPDPGSSKQATNAGSQSVGVLYGKAGESAHRAAVTNVTRRTHEIGAKPKDLIGIPWRVAFALQADGWYLRSDIIWAKPNAMPESVTDRPTRSHEYVFLLSKAARYFYDAAAIAEPASIGSHGGSGANAGAKAATRGDAGMLGLTVKQRGHSRRHAGFNDRWDAMTREEQCSGTRNARDVWTLSTASYTGAHFAVMPVELARRCVVAGSAPGDTVLDPFAGSGTTGLAATNAGRSAILCELNPAYAPLIHDRIGPLLMGAA